MNGSHIGDDAELYAIGVLTSQERESVDAHVAGCLSCLRALGEAEETVLALESEPVIASAPGVRRAMLRVWIAVAAAFVIGFLPTVPLWLAQHRSADLAATRSTATLAMIESHFTHAQFSPVAPNAPDAKVIYARDGSWLYIIVSGSHRFVVYDDYGRVLGTTEPSGTTSELLCVSPARANAVTLREGTNVIERARLR